MPDERNPLPDYPVVIQLPVLWGQMDAFQHVNNTVYFRYFESARIAYGERVEMHRFMRETGVGPILASTGCKFIRPLTYPDTLWVGVRTTRLAETEMEQEYAVFSQNHEAVAAVGEAKIVAYDYRQGKRSPFPQALLDRLLSMEEHLILSRD